MFYPLINSEQSAEHRLHQHDVIVQLLLSSSEIELFQVDREAGCFNSKTHRPTDSIKQELGECRALFDGLMILPTQYTKQCDIEATEQMRVPFSSFGSVEQPHWGAAGTIIPGLIR